MKDELLKAIKEIETKLERSDLFPEFRLKLEQKLKLLKSNKEVLK